MVYSKFCFIVKFFKHLLEIHKRDPVLVSRNKTYNMLSVMSDSLGPHGLVHARLLCPWNFPGKNTGFPLHTPGDLPHPGIKPASPALQAAFYHCTTWEFL